MHIWNLYLYSSTVLKYLYSYLYWESEKRESSQITLPTYYIPTFTFVQAGCASSRPSNRDKVVRTKLIRYWLHVNRFDSTIMRLQFDRKSTTLRPYGDLRCDRTAVLFQYINKWKKRPEETQILCAGCSK